MNLLLKFLPDPKFSVTPRHITRENLLYTQLQLENEEGDNNGIELTETGAEKLDANSANFEEKRLLDNQDDET